MWLLLFITDCGVCTDAACSSVVPASGAVAVVSADTTSGVARLIDTNDFPARWYCGTWSALHGWIHIISDLAIWTAYTAIPILLFYFIRRRPDVPFPRVFWLFCAFILWCGLTHLLEALVFWWPAYRLMGLVKAVTAVVSLATVVALVPVIPRALQLPGMARLNAQLREEVEQRRKAEELFRLAVEASPVANALVHPDGRIALVNRRFETLFGIERGALLNQPVANLVPSRLRGGTDDWAGRITMRDAPAECDVESIGLRSDGEEFPLELACRQVDTSEGAMVLCAFVDLTERRFAEQLRIEQQKEESLSLLAGGIAHDFNNLLVTTLAKAAQLEGSAPFDSQQRRHARGILSASERMAELSRQLLAYARGGKYSPRVLQINEIVRSGIELAREVLPPAVRIESELSPDAAPVEADPTQLSQILLNLCGNAGDAMGERGGRLAIRTGNVERSDWICAVCGPRSGGAYVRLTVADTGVGMSPEVLQRACEPFFSTKAPGRGLGLAAVAGIVRNHGGALEINSEPGHGTTIDVLLPRCERQPEELSGEAARTLRPPTAAEVLVVDDEDVVRDVIVEILRGDGFVTHEAADGETTLEICRRVSLDLVILDLRLPGQSGVELFFLITRLQPRLAIMICSGYESEAISDELRSHPQFAGVLPKPFRPQELIGQARRALQSRML